MTGPCRHHDMVTLTGPSGDRVFVDPGQISAIGTSPGSGKDGDANDAPTLTRILVGSGLVYVAETPEEVMVLRRHVLGLARDPAEPRVANGQRLMPPSEQLDWQYPDIVKTTDIGPVLAETGGASHG